MTMDLKKKTHSRPIRLNIAIGASVSLCGHRSLACNLAHKKVPPVVREITPGSGMVDRAGLG